MSEDNQKPQINISKIKVGGGIIGAIFTLGCMAIFLIGLPVRWYTFPAALVVGCGVRRHEARNWILKSYGSDSVAPLKREQFATIAASRPRSCNDR
jgi:hypothetical protein